MLQAGCTVHWQSRVLGWGIAGHAAGWMYGELSVLQGAVRSWHCLFVLCLGEATIFISPSPSPPSHLPMLKPHLAGPGRRGVPCMCFPACSELWQSAREGRAWAVPEGAHLLPLQHNAVLAPTRGVWARKAAAVFVCTALSLPPDVSADTLALCQPAPHATLRACQGKLRPEGPQLLQDIVWAHH